MGLGALLADARANARLFTESGGFEDNITLTTKDGSLTVTVPGRASGIWINFDTEGNPVNSANNRIAIHEKTLSAANYPVRINNVVSMKDHRVTVNDVNGNACNFVITDVYPNATTGLIMFNLGVAV